MAFDYKKEYKEFYMPKNTPGIINVPGMNYIAVRGQGKLLAGVAVVMANTGRPTHRVRWR